MLERVITIVGLDAALALLLDPADLVGDLNDLTLYNIVLAIDVQWRDYVCAYKCQCLVVISFDIIFLLSIFCEPVHVPILLNNSLTFGGTLPTHLPSGIVALPEYRSLLFAVHANLITEVAGRELVDKAVFVLKALLRHVKCLLHGHGERCTEAEDHTPEQKDNIHEVQMMCGATR